MTPKTTYPFLWLSLCLLILIAGILGFSNRSQVSAQSPDGTSESTKGDKEALARQKFMEQFEADFYSDPQSRTPLAATPCVGGFAGPYPCSNVDLLAFMPLNSIGAGSGSNDIWGWTDLLDGKEYALVGLTNGTSFVDVTDPENPVYLGRLPTQTSNSTWRDIKVYNDYAFIVSEASGHGMQVFDLTRLRNVVNPPVTFTNDTHYNQFGNAHNIAINEDTGYAYAIGSSTCAGGLHMVNIQNPLSPTNAGCYSGDGYTHDTQCVLYSGPDPDYQGDEICFSSNEDSVTVTDVTNKANPLLISRNTYAGSAYTHQGWLTEDQVYFLSDDELDEQNFGHNTRTRIWDMTDLDNPFIINFNDGPNPSIDHNLYTHDGNAYMSNYTSGLQIYDLSDVASGNLTLVAYFDSYTANNNATFNGSWSNYPYFESGTVIHTGIGEGLFITRPILDPGFSLLATETVFSVCVAGEVATSLDLLDQNGYTGTVTLSTVNLPAGSAATFNPSSVIVPGSSTMTVTVSTTPAGTHPFTILADDGTLTDTVDATLHIYDGTPGIVTPTTPADGAVNVPIPVTFEWQAGVQVASYELEIAADSGFANIVYTVNVVGTSHTATFGFDPLTTYYWHVRATNTCGNGTYSSPFSFTTENTPPILLVDDDDNGPDVQATYTSALDNLGLTYDIWDTANSDTEPTATELAPYDIVIWFTGDEFGGAAGPGSAGETALGTWLDAGACLFLSSQDYHYDRGMTTFMTTYLGANAITDDDGDYTSVTGQGGVFGGSGGHSLTYPFTDYADPITPNGTAELAFQGNNGNGAAIDKDNGTYKTTFWVFPWEAINTATGREATLQTFLDWCGGDPEPTPTSTPTETPTPTATEPVPTETPTPTPTEPGPSPTPTSTNPPPVAEHKVYLPIISR